MLDRRLFVKLIVAVPFLARFFASSSKAEAPSRLCRGRHGPR